MRFCYKNHDKIMFFKGGQKLVIKGPSTSSWFVNPTRKALHHWRNEEVLTINMTKYYLGAFALIKGFIYYKASF